MCLVHFYCFFCTIFVVVRVEEWNYVELSEFCHFELFGHVSLPVLRMGCGSINDMFAFQGRQHSDSWSDLVSKKMGSTRDVLGSPKSIWGGRPNLSGNCRKLSK